MARIRTVKPELFRHEDLYESEISTGLPLRLSFIGLFVCCDREGRFKWKPRQLKLDVIPYDDIDFSRVLDALLARGFIKKYTVSGDDYGYIPSWHEHQSINNKESDSKLPSPEEADSVLNGYQEESSTKTHLTQEKQAENKENSTREPHVNDALSTPLNLTQGEGEGKGRERKGREHDSCAEPETDSTPKAKKEQTQNAVITIPLADKSEFPIFKNQVAEWQELYPGIDVMQALRKIKAWNLANPKKRKTSRGILTHVNSWLCREQDKCATLGARGSPHTPIASHNSQVVENLSNRKKVIDGEWEHDDE